jgi:hypothetical protein
MSDFYGLPTAVLENEYIHLEYLTTAGPRIIHLSYHGSPNLLADAHDVSWDTPHGEYFILGGHRLWISPEIPEKTNIPDKSGLQALEFTDGVELNGASEPGSGVRKIVRIELDAKQPTVHLTHTIVNENPFPITIAPWAITMFRQGGTVILPQPIGNVDPHGLLSNRIMVFWPYTRIADTRLIMRDDFILLQALPSLPPFKLGYYNPAGWLAYWLDGILFRKTFDVHTDATYPDSGCNTETYCNDRFVELESLGPLAPIAPGATTRLTETWELYPNLDVPFISDEICSLLGKKN